MKAKFPIVHILFAIAGLTAAIVTTAQDRGFLVLPDKASGNNVQIYDGSYALLVGVSDYSNGWRDLNQIPYELELAKDALELHGFSVTLELQKTTAAELSGVFTEFIKKYGYRQNNRLVFIYSGHGHTWKKGNQGYLVPSDAPLPISDEYPGEEFLSQALHISQFKEWSQQMTVRHALFLFDSCFSGTIFNNTKSLDEALEKTGKRFNLQSAKRKARQFITAGSADETVPAESIFMPAFVDAISLGEADLYQDGVITGAEIGLYLTNEVSQWGKQSPQYGTHTDRGLAKGDMVFVMPNAPPDNIIDRVTRETSIDVVLQKAYEAELKNSLGVSANILNEILADWDFPSVTSNYEMGKLSFRIPNTRIFNLGGTTVSDSGGRLISVLGRTFSRMTLAEVKVNSYSDNIPVGSSSRFSSNVDLTTARANSVATAFVNSGVPSSLISAVGHGASNPLTSNETAEGRMENRRIELDLFLY